MVSPHHGAPGSVISGAGGLPPLHPAAEHFSFSTLHPQQYTGLYPHLQVRNLNVRTKKGEQLVNNLSMEVKAGEILSIMSTNGCVATSLLEVIAGRGQYSGHISLNGQAVSSSDLRRISAYARADSVLHPDLAVHNCLCFYSKLRRPNKSRGKMPIEEQVRMVTEELGLSPVLDTKISELTKSEYSRLLVAIQLLTDPQVLCIGHITHTMDIFDTFFLVEFLRQWASGATGGVTGRIVVMSLQPPTYEILTMVSRLVMLSGGETMYHGPARHLAQYFTSVEYPCPAYKNPSDYYLDLVTLDDLSAEAMLESSQRVDQLASLYRRRQQPLSETQPYALPTKFMLAGPLAQMFALVMKEAVYSQPSSFFKWVSRVLLSALMSVIMGAIFWDIPASDPQLYREDRLGYHYSMMVVAAWPLMMVLGFSRTHGVNRRAAESDLRQNLYNRTLYIVCSLVFTLVPSALIWLAYLLPAYCMTGLYDQSTADGLTFYLGYGVVHLLSLQLWTAAVGEVVPGGRCSAGVVAGLVCAAMGASSGYPLHRADAPAPLVIAAAATPLPWLYTPLVAREMSQDTLTHLNQHLVCRNKQVQHQDIIVQLPCPVANGTLALLHHGFPVESDGQRSQYSSLFDSPPTGSPVVPPLVVLTVAALVTVVAFTLSPLVTMYGRQRR
ncbi:hypothetical protein AAG570_005198 [Ranatra chinensis]|uniref:ABC transporter domain-containing protein n=1 Tax=Ranatra chinensis TaxID=642074 RepID=A0ABD0XZT6_9HEMI